MFDWDDQELENIIWDETSEADDHIVPYPEEIEKKDLPNYGDSDRKKLNNGDTNGKASEQNTCTSKPFSCGGKQESNNVHSALGVIVDPQLDLPSFCTSETDDDAIVEKHQLDIGPEILQNQHEDKELGELVGNSWANIGSFDDLDRIFSNDDLDGNTSLGSANDLWPSSKDLISGAAKSSSQALGSTSWGFGALGRTSTNFEITPGYLHNESHSLSSICQKSDVNSSYSPQNISRCVEEEEFALGTTSLIKEKTALDITVKAELDSHLVSENVVTRNKSAVKENWSNKQSKHVQRTDKIIDSRLLRDSYDRWPSSVTNVPQFDSQCTSATVQYNPASVPTQKRLPQDSSSMVYEHFSDPYVPSYGYGNFAHHHPAMHMPKLLVDEHKSMLSNSEACPGDVISLNKPVETSAKTMNMTPQEKIEKLRRRQQMRAMHAIQKQQQQLGHKASSIDYTLPQKSCTEDQIMHSEKTDDENLSNLPFYDPGSPSKRDDSCAISDIDDFSAEDTVLYQLQDVIARLDLKIRLCVRDSLYRLAKGVTQRSYTNDTSSTNRTGTYGPDVSKEEISSHDRCSGKANMETETNHIDRIVAHLLFHRPFKLPVKPVETPESSTSTKVSTEQGTAAPSSMPVGFLSKSSESEYNLAPHVSKNPQKFIDSCDKDTLNDTPQRELRINPQMNQKMADKAD